MWDEMNEWVECKSIHIVEEQLETFSVFLNVTGHWNVAKNVQQSGHWTKMYFKRWLHCSWQSTHHLAWLMFEYHTNSIYRYIKIMYARAITLAKKGNITYKNVYNQNLYWYFYIFASVIMVRLPWCIARCSEFSSFFLSHLFERCWSEPFVGGKIASLISFVVECLAH